MRIDPTFHCSTRVGLYDVRRIAADVETEDKRRLHGLESLLSIEPPMRSFPLVTQHSRSWIPAGDVALRTIDGIRSIGLTSFEMGFIGRS